MARQQKNELVLLFNATDAHPVFHLSGAFVRRDLEDDGWTLSEYLTACGRAISRLEWRPAPPPEWTETRVNEDRRPVVLRRGHAELFARLCQRCYAAIEVTAEIVDVDSDAFLDAVDRVHQEGQA